MLGEGIDVHLLRVSLILPTPDLGSGISYVHRCGEGGQHPCPGFLWVERKGLEEEDLGSHTRRECGNIGKVLESGRK